VPTTYAYPKVMAPAPDAPTHAAACGVVWSSATAVKPTLKLDYVHIRALLHTIRLKTLLDFNVVIFHVVVYVKTWVVYVET
jgi:hypothetical protein